jgi:cytidine deaminase
VNDHAWHHLKAAAIAAAARSVVSSTAAPRMGAAVIDGDGAIHIGAYIAGATAYTSVHAEAAAIIAAVLSGSRRLVAVAVFCSDDGAVVTPSARVVPCGTCLQMISEYAPLSLAVDIVASTSASLPNWDQCLLVDLLPQPWRKLKR